MKILVFKMKIFFGFYITLVGVFKNIFKLKGLALMFSKNFHEEHCNHKCSVFMAKNKNFFSTIVK